MRNLLHLAFALAVSSVGTPAGAAASPIEQFSATLDAQWNYAKPAESEQRFRVELAKWPPGDPQALIVATQIARSQGLQRDFTAAHTTLDAVDAQLGSAPSHVRVRYLLERGRAFNSSGAPERAVPLFTEALSLAECNEDLFYAVDAAHMLGIAAPREARLDWNRKGLAMIEHATDARTRGWAAALHNNTGEIYHEQRAYTRALAEFRLALVAYESRNNAANIRFARWKVGRAERMLGRLGAAEKIQRALATETERINEPDGYVYEELMEIAAARGDPVGAKAWAVKAYALLKDDPDLNADEPARVARLARLARDPALRKAQ